MSTCTYVYKNNSSKKKGIICGRRLNKNDGSLCWEHKPKKKRENTIIEPQKEEPSENTKFVQLENTPTPKKVLKKKQISSSSSSSSSSSTSSSSSDLFTSSSDSSSD